MSDSNPALKHFEIDSSYRNRQNYPNPYDFVVPFSFPNKGSTSLSFFDPILDSSPFSGSLTLQPGQLYTQVSIDTSNISLDSNDSTINNFYINVTLQIGTEFRTVTQYIGSTRTATVSQPFSSLPAPGTQYFTRKLANYFNSNVSIVGYDSSTNTVNSLNLLTATPSPTTDFYSGSYIRFTNGPHVSNTALITGYDPTGFVTAWYQSDNTGYNEYIFTNSVYGFVFTTSSAASLTQIIFNMIVFESVAAGRTIELKILNGNSLSSPSVYTNTFLLTPTSKSDVTLSISNVFITPTYPYTITIQDITSGGSSNGFVNLFGVDSRLYSFTSFNTYLYPYIIINSNPINGSQDWSQPTITGVEDVISTSTEQGIQFTSSNNGSFNTIILNLSSFESISAGRSLRLRIRSGLGLSGTILSENTIVLTNSNPTDTTIIINNPPGITSGATYTFTFLDTTSGGTSTGYIKLFGISPNVTYVTNNISVYPKTTINVNLIAGTTVTQQGSKLVGTGGVATEKQGVMTAIDDNGTTIAVGAPGTDNVSVGTGVFIYTRTNNTWTQQQLLVGSGISGSVATIGRSVSLSGDGNTVIFGAPGDNSYIGATWVFTRSGGVWSQQGSKLVGTGFVGTANQGVDLTLSQDGNTFVTGGYSDNSNAGAVWVFTRTNGVWSQQGSKLVGTGATTTTSGQGFSTNISSDGNTIAVGGPWDNGSGAFSLAVGATWVFTRTNGVWSQEGSKLIGTGATGLATQGNCVSLSGDGNTLAIGGSTDNSNVGATWIFTRSAGVWTQQGSKLVGSGNTGSSFQGTDAAVELSNDGNTLVVGGFADNSFVGAIWIFTRSGGVWSQQGSKLTPTGNIGACRMGVSVDISYNGSYIITGASADNSSKGATFLFTGSTNTWTQTTNATITDKISTGTEQGFQITSSSGVLSNLTLNLTSFETVSPGRDLRVRVRSGAGVAGSILFSSTFSVSNSLVRNDYNFIIVTSLSSGTYTITVQDLTAGGTTTGGVYIYGITPTVTYVSFNIPAVYPRIFTYLTTNQVTFLQTINPTITTDISTVTEQGWKFIPNFTGFLTKFSANITSFGTSSSRTLTLRVRSGSGVAGTILYQSNVQIPNILFRTDYIFEIPTNVAPTIISGSTYTLSAIDITAGGTATGGVYVYGISTNGTYTSYNMTTYPRLYLYVPSFVINISPPQNFDDFLNDNTDNIEFNTQAHENATTLFYNGLPSTRASYYQIGLQYLIIPNQLLDVSLGGYLDNYPYVYVQLFNEGNKGSLKTLISNNPNSILALFKVPIDKSLYDNPTSFYTLKPRSREQIVQFRPDQDIRFRITLPDGTIVSSTLDDNSTPLFPNPFLQVNALFTLLPLENY
jgi:hypothetical protein